MKSLILAWAQAYNNHDVDALIALYSENVVNTQYPYPRPIQGREGMRATFQKLFQAFPDIHLMIENILEQSDGVAIEWKFSGTMQGDFAGHPATGCGFSIHGCEVFRFQDNQIIAQRGYWDKATMFLQLGIPT